MNLRFYNARILTMKEPIQEICGAIWVIEDRIFYIGKEDNPSASCIKWDREIDCRYNLLMPGFKNMHTHSPMTAMRNLADDLNLSDWLNKKIFPFEKQMSEEDMYYFTMLAILEYLSSGITQIFDMYFCRDAVARACRELGMPLVMCGAVNDFVQSTQSMKELFEKYNTVGDDMVMYRLGFHAPYTTSHTLLDEIAELSGELQAPVYTHLSETKGECEQYQKEYHMSPVEYLCSKHIFDYGGGCFHMVHVDEKDVQLVKDHNLSIVLNPSSNLKLASGIAPIGMFLEKQINVALGTDGASSNNSLSMFKEMFLTSGLAKVQSEDATMADAATILKMATVNANKMLNLSSNTYLEVGQYADFILIDLQKPNMLPHHNLLSSIVYSADARNVKMTVVRGKIMYEDGEYFLPVTSTKIYEECNKRVASFLEKR